MGYVIIKNKNQIVKSVTFFNYLVNLQRSRLYGILRNNNISKTKPTIEYLDCSGEFFVEWIKNKFVDGMTFNNIHLDHKARHFQMGTLICSHVVRYLVGNGTHTEHTRSLSSTLLLVVCSGVK